MTVRASTGSEKSFELRPPSKCLSIQPKMGEGEFLMGAIEGAWLRSMVTWASGCFGAFSVVNDSEWHSTPERTDGGIGLIEVIPCFYPQSIFRNNRTVAPSSAAVFFSHLITEILLTLLGQWNCYNLISSIPRWIGNLGEIEWSILVRLVQMN